MTWQTPRSGNAQARGDNLSHVRKRIKFKNALGELAKKMKKHSALIRDQGEDKTRFELSTDEQALSTNTTFE